jgi:hypothetical protein
MQDEHDAKQDEAEKVISAIAKSINTSEYTQATPIKPFELNLDGAIKNAAKAFEKLKEVDMKEPLKFTREIKLTHKQPEVDMLCRIEYMCPEAGSITADFTFKFETDIEYTGLDKFGNTDIIPKNWFIAWHPIDDNKFNEQINAIVNDCAEGGFNDREKFTVAELITFLQWRDWIVKPLKK